MSDNYIKIHRTDETSHTVYLSVVDTQDLRSTLASLQNAFEECLSQGLSNIVLDFQNVPYPSTSFIALLIEATSRARRLNGDLKLINVSRTARNNFSTFTPLSYLTLEKGEALKYTEPERPEPRPSSPRRKGLLVEDIVEVPIVEAIENVESPAPSIETFEPQEGFHLKVESKPELLYEICDFVTDHATKAGMPEKAIGKTKIAVYEACLNVIEHAYHSKPDNWIDVWVNYDAQKFAITIHDYGRGFEFQPQKGYDVQAAMEGRQTGGFGLYIIRRSMDEVDYQVDPVRGNRLTMIKYLK